ncbi:MAG: hypothetical protein ABFD25_01255 [Clostridiaceae bacterium]
MKSIYLLLTRSESLISKAIRWVTGDLYTHVSMAFDRSLSTLYSFARKYTAFPLPAGLVTEHLDTGFFARHRGMPCALLELQVEDTVYNSARQKLEQMMQQPEMYHYNVVGLISCRLAIPLERRRHYFCSQFVGEILLQSGAVTLPKPVSLMRPVDYDLMPEFSCLFRGQLDALSIRTMCLFVA